VPAKNTKLRLSEKKIKEKTVEYSTTHILRFMFKDIPFEKENIFLEDKIFESLRSLCKSFSAPAMYVQLIQYILGQ
jgi:hypothetical protein